MNRALLAKAKLSRGVWIYKVGGSMDPIFVNVNQLYIQYTDEYKPGDIVLRGKVVHRIICIKKDLISTKGDNLRIKDNPCSTQEIIGRVTKIKTLEGCVYRISADRMVYRISKIESIINDYIGQIVGINIMKRTHTLITVLYHLNSRIVRRRRLKCY